MVVIGLVGHVIDSIWGDEFVNQHTGVPLPETNMDPENRPGPERNLHRKHPLEFSGKICDLLVSGRGKYS